MLSHGYGSASQSRPAVIGDAELSQLVIMHPEAFLACPSAHAGCPIIFKRLANGVVGMNAVGMLRTNAWLLLWWSA